MLTKMCESMGEIVNVHVHGSAMECGAILNACKVLHLADEEVLEARKALLVRIVSMLTKMCE